MVKHFLFVALMILISFSSIFAKESPVAQITDSQGITFYLMSCSNQFGRREVEAHVPAGIDLSSRENALTVFQKITQFAQGKCPREKDIDARLVQSGQTMADAMSQKPGSWSIINHQAFYIAQKKANEAAEARRRAEEQRQKRQKELAEKRNSEIQSAQSCRSFGEFAKKYSVNQLASYKDLKINPFVYKDKIVTTCCNFELMVSENEALFKADNGLLLVSNVPATEFTDKYYVLLAFKTIGTKEVSTFGLPMQVPHVKMEGFTYCNKDCENLLYWAKASNTRDIKAVDRICGKKDCSKMSSNPSCMETFGYCVQSCGNYGSVDLAEVSYGNYGDFVFLNGIPNEVHCATEVANIDLTSNIIKRTFPEATIRDGGEFLKKNDLQRGGQEFEFKYPIVNGCRACEQIGQAIVVFGFDSKGIFQGASLQRMETAGDPARGAQQPGSAEKRASHGVGPVESAEMIVRQIKAQIDVKNYEEADKKLNELHQKFPNLCSSDIPVQTRIDAGIYRVNVDVKLGRVKEKILKDTITIPGKVRKTFEADGDVGFAFTADGARSVDLHCDGGCDGTSVYWLIDDTPVEFGQGCQNLKDNFENAKLYVSGSARSCIENGSCEEELCPVAVSMYSVQRATEAEIGKSKTTQTQPAGPANAEQAGGAGPSPTEPPKAPAPSQALQSFSFEKPIATAGIRAKSIIYEDPNLQNKAGELEAPSSLGITGFVRDDARHVVAVQIAGPDPRKSSYVRSDDITELKQLDENEVYLQTLLTSSVFNPNGKATAKETMKSIDAYLTNQPTGQFGPDAILDYLLCLDSLFRNDQSANKDAIIRLAEIYLAKSKERYPDKPETQKAQAVVDRLKAVAKQ